MELPSSPGALGSCGGLQGVERFEEKQIETSSKLTRKLPCCSPLASSMLTHRLSILNCFQFSLSAFLQNRTKFNENLFCLKNI